MKKIFLSMLMLATLSTAMAQTPEEKAAMKAAAAAQKAAEKEAESQVKQAMKLRDEATTLMNVDPITKKPRTAEDTLKALSKCKDGFALINTALEGGNVPEKKLYDAMVAKKELSNYLMNDNIQKYNKCAFDTVMCCDAIKGVVDGMAGIIKYHKKNDETQVNRAKMERANLPRMAQLLGYRCYFYIMMKDAESAGKALKDYENFPKRFPFLANDPNIANPDPSYEQLAFNIYYTAFSQKNYELASKFYDKALKFDDEQSHSFVVSSRSQMLLQKGDTVAWVNSLMDVVKEDPSSQAAENAVQNLLAYYSKKGNKEMSGFADQILGIAPESKVANYGKGYSLFSDEKYQEALPYFKKTIEIDFAYVDGNYMAGMCLYRQAQDNYFKFIDGKKFKTDAELKNAEQKYVKSFYQDAVPFFEACRDNAPEQPDRWAGPLNNIYKNLGQKQKAAEMEAYIK